jgi:hypothetical protein
VNRFGSGDAPQLLDHQREVEGAESEAALLLGDDETPSYSRRLESAVERLAA